MWMCVCTRATVCLCMLVCDKESLLSPHIRKGSSTGPMPLLNTVPVPRSFTALSLLRRSLTHKTQQLGSDPLSRLEFWSLCAPAVKTMIVIPSPGLYLELIISTWKFHCSHRMFGKLLKPVEISQFFKKQKIIFYWNRHCVNITFRCVLDVTYIHKNVQQNVTKCIQYVQCIFFAISLN